MTRNHLPGGLTWRHSAGRCTRNPRSAGIGFGLGLAVVMDPVRRQGAVFARASCRWGGAASTTFWIDPAEELTVSFFTQLLPSSTYPIRPQLRQLVYQALE